MNEISESSIIDVLFKIRIFEVLQVGVNNSLSLGGGVGHHTSLTH